MKKEHITKTVSDLKQRVENLESQNQPAQPSDKQSPMEVAQATHQAALASFKTKRVGDMNVSLASHPDSKKIEDGEQQPDA